MHLMHRIVNTTLAIALEFIMYYSLYSEYMEERCLETGDDVRGWTKRSIDVFPQLDSYNCGIHCLMVRVT
jgi:hypothetical protein